MKSKRSGYKPSATSCGACRILRRRCSEKCVLAPYLPPNDLHKFATVHRVFGASNMIKMLKDLPINQRGDAVDSMVYEANARLRDPVYGCALTIFKLQQRISHLQTRLAAAQAELLNLRLHHSNLVSLVYDSGDEAEPISPCQGDPVHNN
ncbi:hypothetical protein KI387_003351, partial [Taxus chinensis]